MTPSQAAMTKARELVTAIADNWDDFLRHKTGEFMEIESARIAAALDEAAQERDAAERREREAMADCMRLSAECERLKRWEVAARGEIDAKESRLRDGYSEIRQQDEEIYALRARLARCEAVVEAARKVRDNLGDGDNGPPEWIAFSWYMLNDALSALDEKEG